MKRRLFILAACLFMGAVLNVAVAWGCALWSDEGRFTYFAGDGEWLAPVPPGWSGTPVVWSLNRGFGLTQREVSDTVRAGSSPRQRVQWSALAGLPLRCLYTARHQEESIHGFPRPLEWRSPEGFWDGLVAPRWVSAATWSRFLPTRPLWGGLLINTAVYAGALLVLAAAHSALLCTLRRRRGRCVRCGYDLTGLSTGAACPECGGRPHAVAAHAGNEVRVPAQDGSYTVGP